MSDRAGRRSPVPALLVLALMVGAPSASAYSLRLRWGPSPSADIIGYDVWIRPVSGQYTTPLDARLPPTASDGTLSFTVSNLDPTVSYACSVTAYTATREPSPRSNEVVVNAPTPPPACTTDGDCSDGNACNGPGTCRAGSCTAGPPLACDDHDPCTADGCSAAIGCTHAPVAGCVRCRSDTDCADGDRCTTAQCAAGVCAHEPITCPAPGACEVAACDPATGCVTAPASDGTPCPTDDACEAGACAAGLCTAPTPASTASGASLLLDVRRLVVGRGGRLLARGSFPATPPVDPVASGVLVELRADDGRVVYGTELPAAAFSRRGIRPARYLATAARAKGLRRLVFIRRARRVAVELRARLTPTEGSAAAGRRVTWLLRFGAACVRRQDLLCTPAKITGLRCVHTGPEPAPR